MLVSKRSRLLIFILLIFTSLSRLSWAQTSTSRGQAAWYAVQNNVLVLKTGATAKVLKAPITLPNGNRLEPQTTYVVLPNGEHSPLGIDDMVLTSGEIIRVSAPKTASAPAPALAADAPALAAKPGRAPFSYVPAAPTNGKLKGVVELGASGFNSFIVRVDAQRNWKLAKAEFGNSLVLENMATDDDVRRGLKAYIGRMLDYGVDGHDIYFVVSSGAATAENTKHIVLTLKQLGYVVNVVTPDQEGALGLRATVPAAFADKAFLVDMGSANTKIGWTNHGASTVVSTYGSKFYQQQVPETTVVTDVKAKATQVPANHRQVCFIIGGMPYELAKPLRQGQEPYTVLKPAADYTQLEGAKVQAGRTIYAALAEATGCQQFVFSWDANFTIGYLLSKP